MKKIVAIDAHMLGDRSGGNESYYFNLINHFVEDDQIKLILFVQPEYDTRKITAECEIVKFRSNNAFMRNFIEIPQMVNRYCVDILHMQYFIPLWVPCKVVVTIHDISFEHFRDIFTKKDYITQKLLIPYAAKHSDMIFTVSEYSKRDIIQHYQVPEAKVVVTYNGAADVYVSSMGSELRGDVCRTKVLEGYGVLGPYILTVGNLQPRKNLRRLLQAYEKFCKSMDSSVQMVIVGKKAWMYDDLFAEIEKSELEARIVLTDYVEEENLAVLYSNALLFVYPSYFEGFGIPVLEAMYCGVPVATSNCTSLPEVVGEAGLLFDPYDVDDICAKMKNLYQNKALREELIKKGMKRAAKFSWTQTAQIVMNAYQNL